MFLGLLPSFFCNQDLWSWIVAILQDSMPSVTIHLHLTFKLFIFVCVLCSQAGTMVLDIATATPSLVVIDKQPSTHMLNLQPHVCQLSEIDGNLAEADPHQCHIQTKPVPMAHHHIRHCHKFCISRHDASGGCYPGLSRS